MCGIKIVLSMFVTETRLETGPVILAGGMISYIIKKKKSCLKKVLHDNQQMYWENYCNSLNNNSKLSQVWYNVKKMLGNALNKKGIPTLIQNDIPYELTTEKSNLFAENFSKVSSTDNYSSQFKNHKLQVENNDHNNITSHFNNNNNCYNAKFTLQKMKDAIAETNNIAPGKDRLSYNMFKYLLQKHLVYFYYSLTKYGFYRNFLKFGNTLLLFQSIKLVKIQVTPFHIDPFPSHQI